MINLVLTYKSIHDLNIGDYIQSTAALQFFEGNDVELCDREELNEYKGDAAKLIMNCWFATRPENFPPSSQINPLFISFHLNSSIADKFLENKENVEYLLRFKAVGCRDMHTANLLKSKGIQGYFSGCLTLTLGDSYKPNSLENKICVVDAISTRNSDRSFYAKASELLSDLVFLSFNVREILKVKKSLYENNNIINRNIFDKARRIQYSIQTFKVVKNLISPVLWPSIIYYTHHYNSRSYKSDSQRFKRADFLLNEYSSSSLVISSRIHCILPSTGIGVPAIYLNQKGDDPFSECRKKGLTDLFNVVDLEGAKIINNEFGTIKNTVQIKTINKHQSLVENMHKNIIDYLVIGDD